MQNLSPEEREATLARMRERGIDPTIQAPAVVDAAVSVVAAVPAHQAQVPPVADVVARRHPRIQLSGQNCGDSGRGRERPGHHRRVFAPLVRTISRGTAWIFANNQLQRMPLRLGITDGQNTELVEGDLKAKAQRSSPTW